MNKNGLFMFNGFAQVALLTWLALFSTSCSKSPDDARREISDKGLRFKADSFVGSASKGDLETVKLFLLAGI